MSEKAILRIRDIAKIARVSDTTVARVLKWSSSATEESCRKVLKAIKELSYIPDISASHLPPDRSYTIGAIIPYFEKMFSSYYEMRLVKGVDSFNNPLKPISDLGLLNRRFYDRLLLVSLFGLY